jgi:hypothetical protein
MRGGYGTLVTHWEAIPSKRRPAGEVTSNEPGTPTPGPETASFSFAELHFYGIRDKATRRISVAHNFCDAFAEYGAFRIVHISIFFSIFRDVRRRSQSISQSHGSAV